jgi:YfiR/HmsC-like
MAPRRALLGAARAVLAALLVGLAALALPPGAAAQGSALEYAVKATYLYKFGPFVAWPPGAFASPTAPVRICVAGQDPFGDILDRAVEGQRIGERPIVLERLRGTGGAGSCHILYVGDAEGQAAAETLALVGRAPVLTITDAAPGGSKGVINFVMVDNRVRFEIDNEAAAQKGLHISSKLLNLAISVRRRA